MRLKATCIKTQNVEYMEMPMQSMRIIDAKKELDFHFKLQEQELGRRIKVLCFVSCLISFCVIEFFRFHSVCNRGCREGWGRGQFALGTQPTRACPI